MSAAIFGASLLEDVQEESLDKLLQNLRYGLEPETKDALGVAQLDRLLNLFRYPDSERAAGSEDEEARRNDTTLTSGANQGYHLELSTGGEFISHSRVKPAIIELGHSASATGKSNFLYHITAASILPRSQNGKEATVIWLDTDISFSASRLYQVCVHNLSQADISSTSLATKHDIVEESLKHLHIFPISSSKQLIAFLDNLEHYLLQTPTPNGSSHLPPHHSAHRPLSLIILDSATAFYWPDRFDAEIARLESIKTPSAGAGSTGPVTQVTPVASTTTQILLKLRVLQAKFDCVCIYTTTTTTNISIDPPPRFESHSHTPRPLASHRLQSHPATEPTLTPTLGTNDSPTFSPWTLAATLSLTLTRIPVAQFASHMTLQECLRDRTKRQDVVAKNRIRVGVNEEWLGRAVARNRGDRDGSRDWNVRGALGRMENRGAFVIRVLGDGVEIE